MRRLAIFAAAVTAALCVRLVLERPMRRVDGAVRAEAIGDGTARQATRAIENRNLGPSPAEEPQPLARCFPGDVGGSPPRLIDALLDRASDMGEQGQWAGSLACADEASRGDPTSVEAHGLRADALRELKRLPEAQDAFARALALDPDDAKTLAGAADFFINRLPPSNEHTEIGLAYARRGSRKLKRSHDRSLLAQLAWLEGQALSDLGRPREALARLDVAIAASPDDGQILYERAVAEFELCRFDDARRDFADVVRRHPLDAGAHYHLGLIHERMGDSIGAERELGQARALAPADYKPEVMPPPEEFRRLVEHEVSQLPEPLRKDLATCQLETVDLPDLADLVAEEPPLSPTILGMFRGAPLGDPVADPRETRTIFLYRKNLGRAVTSREDLITQIRTTLVHELGHLRGEDDDDLRARGLE